MNLLREFQLTLSSGVKALPFWGKGGFSGGWLRSLDRGSSIDYEREISPIHVNSVVSIGIGQISQWWMAAPPIIQRLAGDKDGEPVWEGVNGHWAEELFEFPMPDFTGSQFWSGTLIGLLTYGDAFIYAPFNNKGEREFLHILPSWLITPKSDIANPNGLRLVTHYEYRPVGSGETISIPAEFVIHLKVGFDPLDQRRGFAPLRGQFEYIYGDNAGGKYTAGLMSNFGIPSVVFSPKGSDQMITADQIGLLKASINSQFSGEGAGRPSLSPFPMDMARLGFSPSEMDIQALRSVPVDRICAALGVDPMAFGLPSSSKTYSNYEEARRAAWSNTIKPLKLNVADQLTQALFPRAKGQPKQFRVWWNFDEVPELQEAQDKKHQRVREDFKADLLSRHAALTELGFPIDNVPDLYYSEARGLGPRDPRASGAAEGAKTAALKPFDEG